MTSVDIVLDHYLWKKKIKNPKIYIRKKLLKLNKIKLFQNKSKNCTVFLTKNKTMKKLNKKFRNKNKPTDVLSFPFKNKMKHKKNIYLGDIAISYEIVNKRSKKLLGHLKEISVVDFDHSDVVRHPLVSKIVKAYSDQNND